MQIKNYNIFILLYVLLIAQALAAQYTPYFQNYSLSDYNAGNQNWGVSTAENGKLYVANNNGLLEFDGLKWSFMELPNKTTIRSVLAYKNLIFTGSYEEFGFWKKNTKGELLYTSLSDSIEQKESSNEEFWQILPFKDAIIFRSFSNLYIYKEGKVSRVKPKSTVISCNIVDEKFYVSTLNDGIFTLEGEVLKESIISPTLISKDIVVTTIINFNNKLMMATALKGCFIYSNNELTPWISEINEIIKEHQLNTFSTLSNGNMVFGTIKNGVYITNHSGKVMFHINKENGLINNTILSQCVAADAKLWLGMDNGLASIELNSHHSFYNDISGKLGAVYDVILYKGIIYIGSNTGLYFLDSNNKLQFIEDSHGQVWDLKEINGELFCGHNSGTYLIQNKKLVKISNVTGGWVIKKVPEQRNVFIQGTYTGLVRFKNNKGIWDVKRLGETTIPIRFLVFEDEFTAWAAHAYKGLYRIKFNKDYESIVDDPINYGNKGLLSDYNVRVYKIKNDIVFKTNKGWQKYEPLLDSIVPFKLLNENFGKDAYIISEYDTDQLVIKNSKDVINFKSLADNKNDLTLTSKFFQNKLIVGIEKISKFNDSIYALNLNDGFMVIDKTNSLENNVLEKPVVERIQIDKNLIELNESNIFELPYNKSISISVSSAKSNGHFFEYSISNSDSIHWYKMENEKLEKSNLNSGDYTILFRAANTSGAVSPIEELKLEVLPPWYKDKIGGLLYVVIVILIGLLMYLLHKRKINKEQKALQLKFVKEQQEILKEKAIENDKKIIELKNESLKNEIKLKSKQLANTAMALVKKNESMLEIKKELIQIKNSFDNHFSYKKLLKRIDSSIGHEDEWEVFEYNFNQVHEEFFNQLKTQFPELTHKDLKICAYIKMNLLSKEIAPLMNISIRGVETHRYRLKRKLNLDNDSSLTNYLTNFK